jgi:hypothetical protein
LRPARASAWMPWPGSQVERIAGSEMRVPASVAIAFTEGVWVGRNGEAVGGLVTGERRGVNGDVDGEAEIGGGDTIRAPEVGSRTEPAQ